MMHELVRMYEEGAITADHLVVESLHKVDPAEPGLVLSHLPPELLGRMLIYADHYGAGGMKTNYGLLPAPDQVAAAKRWIETALRHPNGAAALKSDCVELP